MHYIDQFAYMIASQPASWPARGH